jgi:hypothetical protein
LAYGQTGSGKTYSMGTGFEVSAVNEENVGIVPRAVHQLFDGIAKRQEEARESGTMTIFSLTSLINFILSNKGKKYQILRSNASVLLCLISKVNKL